MLTAAVCGDVFASPSVDAVLAGILAVTGSAGCLLIVKNYTGDRLYFGLAAERARSFGLRVSRVIVDDDVALPDLPQARGLAGTLFVHKIAGAMAETGANLEACTLAAQRVINASRSIANIGEEIRGRGHDHRFELLSCERLSAPVDVAASLQLQAGASVFHLLGVHHENGVAVQLEDRWVNPRVAPDFLEQDFSTEQPSDWLVRNVAFDEIEHVVDAMLPTAWQAEHLQITPTEPCLMLTRRTWCRGQVVTMVRCLHPGARYRLGSRFRPQHGHGY